MRYVIVICHYMLITDGRNEGKHKDNDLFRIEICIFPLYRFTNFLWHGENFKKNAISLFQNFPEKVKRNKDNKNSQYCTNPP